MGETLGVLAAMLSSALGGSSIGATRWLAGRVDPLTIGAFRFGLGFLFLVPVAVIIGGRMPSPAEWLRVAGLGLLFFGLFPVLFNASLIFTTAARAALALSTLPLLTMTVAAALGIEPLTLRKTAGVLIAMAGVAMALLLGLGEAPPGAWRGDLLMIAGALAMALYNVWSRPLVRALGPIPYTAAGMAVGGAALTLLAWVRGGLATTTDLSPPEWLALLYLGLLGGALTFWLWAVALRLTTPTRVSVSVTVNPIVASSLGALLLGEPIAAEMLAGLVAVLAGIALATTEATRPAVAGGGSAR